MYNFVYVKGHTAQFVKGAPSDVSAAGKVRTHVCPQVVFLELFTSGSAESIFSAPFVARSAWSVASDFVGEVLGMLTMIIAINCLRRIALMMTNPFGDE